jgi:hypothetical protein
LFNNIISEKGKFRVAKRKYFFRKFPKFGVVLRIGFEKKIIRKKELNLEQKEVERKKKILD